MLALRTHIPARCLPLARSAMRVVFWVGLIVQFEPHVFADDPTGTVADTTAIVEDTPALDMAEDEPLSRDVCVANVLPSSIFGGKVVAGADLLLLRPAFSNATAAYVNTQTGGSASPKSSLDAVNYDFDATTGLRAFIGYQVSPDSVLRFTYTNFAAKMQVASRPSGDWPGNGTIVYGPYFAWVTFPGEVLTSTAEVNLNLYDVEWARRIGFPSEVGGCQPMWDAAWGVGLRFADVSVATTAFADRIQPNIDDILVTTNRGFHGVGPRVAGQLRRYFGERRHWSGFASVGATLLVGSLNDTATQLTLDLKGTSQSQHVGGTKVIPNLDLSLGGSWQVAERTSISVGWMLMYFGDLGYAETVRTEPVPKVENSVPNVPLTYSNLTFDGVFFRLAHNF